MIDQVQIYVKAGQGGDGGMTFHRAKYIPKGGPDGGNGGRGGDVVLRATRTLRTLAPFKYKKKYKAENGQMGAAGKSSGKTGANIVVDVPVGTLVRDRSTGEVLCDLNTDEMQFVAAKGGRGGLGNYNFTTSTRQSPRFAQGGAKGEERTLVLELKLLADVGLLGLPNVGKSTFLSVVTRAKPKIGNYPFTTIEPNLGVVEWKNFDTFVIADIPGIIEGASEGVGLGLDFLRHVERTKLLIHFLDVAAFDEVHDPLDDFNKINAELSKYSEALAEKPQLVALSKCDVAQPDVIARVKTVLNERGYEVFEISALTRLGIDKLLGRVIALLDELPEPVLVSKTTDNATERLYTLEDRHKDRHIDIKKEQLRGGRMRYTVTADFLDQLIRSVNFDDLQSVGYFQRRLKQDGVIKALETAGIAEEDIVAIGDTEFEYFKS